MASSQAIIKLNNLTKFQQETVKEYYPVIEKLFLAKPTNDTQPVEAAEKEFKVDILQFLSTLDAIFGENLPKPVTFLDKSRDQFIIESALQRFRIRYREEFSGNSYLTVIDARHSVCFATSTAYQSVNENSAKFGLTQKETDVLKVEVSELTGTEANWIREVNNFKKTKVLNEIKAKILKDLNMLIYEELPDLVGETQYEFYENLIFRQRVLRLMRFASESFEEQIPHKEDKFTEEKILKELNDQIRQILMDLCHKNRQNKNFAERIIATETHYSVEKYTREIDQVLKEEPIADTNEIRTKHENLQWLNMPSFSHPNPGSNDFKSVCTQRYFKETDKVFQQQIHKHGKVASDFFNESYQELSEVVDKVVGGDITQIFQKRKLPTDSIEQIRQSFSKQLERVVNEIKDSTIANPKVCENLAHLEGAASDLGLSLTKVDSVAEATNENNSKPSDNEKSGLLIQVKIRLLTGKTYKIDAFNSWTVKQLRQRLIALLDEGNKTCLLYNKCTRLQDENSLHSYNIRNGDFLMASIK